MNWINTNKELPEYYQPVFVELTTGKILKAWRASDGDQYFWTEYNGNLIYFDDEIIEYYYNGTLDTRTTKRCWTLTTTPTISKNKSDITKLLSFHYNCRAILGTRTNKSEDFL